MAGNKGHDCDVVIIKTKDKQSFEGMMMPASDNQKVVLKLNSGYNMGVLRKNIQSLQVKKKFKGTETCSSTLDKKFKGKPAKANKKLPTIAILHTGGTIASEVDYDIGGVTARFTPEEIIAMFPELKTIANIRSRLIRNMFSEDLRFFHYNLLAKEVAKEVKAGVDGIIITHGTDTLHYTAAALAFALEDLNIPVLLVGAQRSSDRAGSDAAMNITCAAKFITQTDFAEVGLCMHESMEDTACLILPACRSRKLHTSRRDAFKVISGSPWARVSCQGNIKILDNTFKKKEKRKLKLKLFNEKLKISILKAHPHMFAAELKQYDRYHGLILEGFGMAGNFPINEIDKETKEHSKIYKEIQRLAKKMPVIMTSQTIFGRINQNVYTTGRKLQEANVLGNLLNITTETAFMKLAWLLSNHPKQVRTLFHENLRGEITKRTTPEDDFDF